MLNRWQYLMFGFAVLSVLVATSARAEIDGEDVEELSSRGNSIPSPLFPGATLHEPPITPLPPLLLSNLEQPATTVEEWIAQIEQSAVQITGVRVNATETGLEITLETDEPLEAPATSVVGNALIADISNAVLALPEGEEFLIRLKELRCSISQVCRITAFESRLQGVMRYRSQR
jgi:iron complex outermembrane recepter protein